MGEEGETIGGTDNSAMGAILGGRPQFGCLEPLRISLHIRCISL